VQHAVQRLISMEYPMRLKNQMPIDVDPPLAHDSAKASYRIVDDFLPTALALSIRDDVEAHFAAPEKHSAERHQVWNYWHVPDLYTYLRTSPEHVIERSRMAEFMKSLTQWSENELGLTSPTRPYLSLYVPGCHQGVHNDSANGRFGFVYSLTKAQRSSIGGSTIIFRENNPFRSNLHSPGAGTDFFARVPPQFNRLLVFDDRLPHGVDRVDGSMDPVEGRLVLHGHLREGGPIVRGALAPDEVADKYISVLLEFCSRAAARMKLLSGLLSLKFRILATGEIQDLQVLVDRVIFASSAELEWPRLLELLLTLVRATQYGTSEGITEVVFPFVFGVPVVQESP
jgi:Rps23 Pro-64 3,4-dihydroxylase Tpa1-like proline 4-hydroxylase